MDTNEFIQTCKTAAESTADIAEHLDTLDGGLEALSKDEREAFVLLMRANKVTAEIAADETELDQGGDDDDSSPTYY